MTEKDELIPRRELQSLVVSMHGDVRELQEEVASLQRQLAGLREGIQQGRML